MKFRSERIAGFKNDVGGKASVWFSSCSRLVQTFRSRLSAESFLWHRAPPTLLQAPVPYVANSCTNRRSDKMSTLNRHNDLTHSLPPIAVIFQQTTTTTTTTTNNNNNTKIYNAHMSSIKHEYCWCLLMSHRSVFEVFTFSIYTYWCGGRVTRWRHWYRSSDVRFTCRRFEFWLGATM